MKENCSVTIHFIDGSMLSFDFSEKLSDADKIAARIKNFFKYEYFMIESEGSLLFFLLRNIKYIETYPATDVEQANIIKAGKAVK